jgi:Iap family predicted aminopeptidase
MMPRVLAGLIATLALAAPATAAPGPAYDAALHLARDIGPRPAAGSGERAAQAWVGARFRAAGLPVAVQPFRVPGRGASSNVIGRLDTPARCLDVVMAHVDSVPPGHGANDNASGVGVLVALAGRLPATATRCDVWLVSTGAEERVVTGRPDHLGAAALLARVRTAGRARDLRLALSLDMVGRGTRFWLRSNAVAARPAIEGRVLRAARRARVGLVWVRDAGTGASDHREFQLAGLPAVVIEAWRGSDPCWHAACDLPARLQPAALDRALRLARQVLRGG